MAPAKEARATMAASRSDPFGWTSVMGTLLVARVVAVR